jgi:hypothetical protein
MTGGQTASLIGGLTLLVAAGPLMMALGLGVGVHKRRGLVTGVDWSRVAHPDRLLGRLGVLLAATGAGFILAGAAMLFGWLPLPASLIGVVALSLTLAFGTPALIARAQAPGRATSRRSGQ